MTPRKCCRPWVICDWGRGSGTAEQGCGGDWEGSVGLARCGRAERTFQASVAASQLSRLRLGFNRTGSLGWSEVRLTWAVPNLRTCIWEAVGETWG